MTLIRGEDGRARCHWSGAHADYQAYHDAEWGFPVSDDRRLFEKICLEGFQSGLSWLTILRKRENFRRAFANFDAAKVARFGTRDVSRLLADAGIVRHRGKIEASISNARAYLDLMEAEGSLAAFAWSFEPGKGERPAKRTLDVLRTITTTPGSIAMSKELKRRGWKFVGPTTVYAFMQAMGLVNDHFDGCHVQRAADAARRAFARPARGA